LGINSRSGFTKAEITVSFFLELVQIVDYCGQEDRNNPDSRLFWSLQGRIVAFTTPQFQILNRLLEVAVNYLLYTHKKAV
jgi:hypothetical protein